MKYFTEKAYRIIDLLILSSFLSIFHLKCGIKLDSFYIIIVMNANSDNLCYTLVFLCGLFTDSAAGFLLIPLFTQFQYDNFTNLWE